MGLLAQMASTPRSWISPPMIDCAVVHGIAEVLAGISANDHATALHHEPGERRTGVAANNDVAALLVDASA